MGLLWSLYPLIYPYVRVIHISIEIQGLWLREKRRIVFPCDDLEGGGGSVEIQGLCLREKRRIIFPCDDVGECNIARIRKSMDRVNEEPL
jgi:hypothetical protein